MELIVLVGAIGALAIASVIWGEDSRDFPRGAGLIEVYTVEDEMRMQRTLLDRRATTMALLQPRARVTPIYGAALAWLGGSLVRVGTALQRRALAAA